MAIFNFIVAALIVQLLKNEWCLYYLLKDARLATYFYRCCWVVYLIYTRTKIRLWKKYKSELFISCYSCAIYCLSLYCLNIVYLITAANLSAWFVIIVIHVFFYFFLCVAGFTGHLSLAGSAGSQIRYRNLILS